MDLGAFASMAHHGLAQTAWLDKGCCHHEELLPAHPYRVPKLGKKKNGLPVEKRSMRRTLRLLGIVLIVLGAAAPAQIRRHQHVVMLRRNCVADTREQVAQGIIHCHL